jgi:hypothetical protein
MRVDAMDTKECAPGLDRNRLLDDREPPRLDVSFKSPLGRGDKDRIGFDGNDAKSFSEVKDCVGAIA